LDEPAIVAASVRPAEIPPNDSVYQYLANVESLDKANQLKALEKYLSNLEPTNDYARRLVAEKLLKIEPESTAANRWMLDYQFRQGNNTQTIELATKLIKSNPSDKELFSLRARGLSNLGDKELAVKDFIKAIALGDESEETLNRLGGIYGALGRFDLAITVYDRSLTKNPSNFNALLLSGVAQAADGNQEKAYEMLRRALVASLSKDNLEQAKRARNALQSTGTYDMLSDVDKQFMASKFK
jgi:tetratricopeptide (TPR) repeat protein